MLICYRVHFGRILSFRSLFRIGIWCLGQCQNQSHCQKCQHVSSKPRCCHACPPPTEIFFQSSPATVLQWPQPASFWLCTPPRWILSIQGPRCEAKALTPPTNWRKFRSVRKCSTTWPSKGAASHNPLEWSSICTDHRPNSCGRMGVGCAER